MIDRKIIFTALIVIGALVLCGPREKKDQEPTSYDIYNERADSLWEEIPCRKFFVCRTVTPGGWLVLTYDGAAYVPDSNHTWDIK